MRTRLRLALSPLGFGSVEAAETETGAAHWYASRRTIGLVAFTAVAVAGLTYMVRNVPLMGPSLTHAEATRYWGAALIGASIVAAYALLIIGVAARDRRQGLRKTPAVKVDPSAPAIPRSLGFERVPVWAIVAATAISTAGIVLMYVLGVRLWMGGLAFILPWAPLVAVEARSKFLRYGVFGGFALVCLLQVLHMGEHSTQVAQLAISDGILARSHGVFGQLDFELVHFVTDTTLWLTLGLFVLLIPGNKWLWVAFAAASLHQIEHFYLFWVYHAHNGFYLDGGFAGIMGKNGIIGSPLDRPYLHFTYNLIVIVPMLVALWDEGRRIDATKPRPRRWLGITLR
jgi:hypothetical protein